MSAFILEMEQEARRVIESVDTGWPTGSEDELVRAIRHFMEAAAEYQKGACAQIARDFASGFKPGTPESDISYAAVIAVAKLIEGGGK